jgi:hypothetical protein
MKNEVNVASKSIKQKIRLKKLFFVAVLKVTGKNSRIRIRIRIRTKSRIRITGKKLIKNDTKDGLMCALSLRL